MKKRAEFLVTKRDGRQEWLRASKLARSIHQALATVRDGEDSIWRALELSATVLMGLRSKRELEFGEGEALMLTTEELAVATHQVLAVTGNAVAAEAYADAGARQRRRQAVLRQRSFIETATVGEDFDGGGAPSSGRWHGFLDAGDDRPSQR